MYGIFPIKYHKVICWADDNGNYNQVGTLHEGDLIFRLSKGNNFLIKILCKFGICYINTTRIFESQKLI